MIRVIRDLVAIEFRHDRDRIGHIWVPEIAKERSDQGIVKYIGPKAEFVLPGDYVIFSAYDGTNVHIEKEEGLIILPESKIVAIIHPPEFPIPGLYFRYRKTQEEVNEEYYELAKIVAEEMTGTDFISIDVENTVKKILKSGFTQAPYQECSYEQAITLVRKGLQESKIEIKWKDRMKSAPRREDL